MPKSLRSAFLAAIQVAGETEYDGEEGDRERFQRRMIERIITNFEDPDEAMGDENIEYLMAKLAQIDGAQSKQQIDAALVHACRGGHPPVVSALLTHAAGQDGFAALVDMKN